MLNTCSVFYMGISIQYADIHAGGGAITTVGDNKADVAFCLV